MGLIIKTWTGGTGRAERTGGDGPGAWTGVEERHRAATARRAPLHVFDTSTRIWRPSISCPCIWFIAMLAASGVVNETNAKPFAMPVAGGAG